MTLPEVFSCIKRCFNCTAFPAHQRLFKETNSIKLDSTYIGHDVVILKDGTRICGAGGSICTAPLVQNKSYFEVKLQQTGIWGIGLATKKTDLSNAPGGTDKESWVFCYDGTIRNNGVSLKNNLVIPNEGSIIGVSYDHIELNYYIDGKLVGSPVSGIKGCVYPALYVNDGAVLDFITENFEFPVPNGFEQIMIEQSLL